MTEALEIVKVGGQKFRDALEEVLLSECGEYTAHREFGLTPNGNAMNGRWALRDDRDQLVDFDKYRNDLAERNNIQWSPK